MSAVVVLLATRDQLLATWENVVIVVWHVDTTMDGVKALQEAYDTHAAQHPGGIFLLTVVEQNAPLPQPRVRTALAIFLTRAAGPMILSAVIHEGAGFRAAAVRSVVTGLALLSKLPYRHRVFSTVEAAVGWFRETAPVARKWGERELQEVVAELRASVG